MGGLEREGRRGLERMGRAVGPKEDVAKSLGRT